MIVARLVRAKLAVVSVACAACGASGPMSAGHLTSTGGELGDFVFSPDACTLHGEADALDLRDSRAPWLAVRVVHPASNGFVVVVENERVSTHAVPLVPSATCTIHKGYHAVLYGDAGVGLRIECTTPAGGHLSGAIGAGVCE